MFYFRVFVCLEFWFVGPRLCCLAARDQWSTTLADNAPPPSPHTDPNAPLQSSSTPSVLSAANVWNTGHTTNHTASTAVGDANGLRQTTVEHDCAPESTRLPRTPMSPTQREGQTRTATPIYLFLHLCVCTLIDSAD